jgi:hypothetical protein
MVFRPIKFCTVARNIFGIIVAVLISLTYKNVHHLTCTEQRASDDSETDRSLQNYGPWVWHVLHIALPASTIWRWFVDFRKNLWILTIVPSPESPLPIYVWRLLVTLTHVRVEKSVLFLGSFFAGEVRLVTKGRLGGPQNRSGAVANREILSPAGGHNAVTEPVASRPSCLK